METRSSPAIDEARHFLRHTTATLSYRAGKVLRGAPEGFSEFRVAEKTRTPGQILVHLVALLDWGLSLAGGKEKWHESNPSSWDADTKRFFEALEAFDNYLASGKPLHCPAEKLFQGPVADALTHVGQIGMLRRLAGIPVRGENYQRADIVAGRVGPEQAPPAREFD
jgi:hypothetical protein